MPRWGFAGGDHLPPPEARTGSTKLVLGFFLQGASGCESPEPEGRAGEKGNCFLSEMREKYTCAKDCFKEKAEARKLFQETPFYAL